MKYLVLILYFLGINLSLNAQNWCDSTYAVCDSISIDTVFQTNNTLGNRIHFQILSDHNNLYAPVFIICPDIDTINFIDDQYFLFGIGGPSSVPIYFEISNFIPSYSDLTGHIVVGNSNNNLPNCIIEFENIIDPLSWSKQSPSFTFEVYPNPSRTELIIKLSKENTAVGQAQLIDHLGKKHMLNVGSLPYVNISDMSPGNYILQLETSNGEVLSKQIVIE